MIKFRSGDIMSSPIFIGIIKHTVDIMPVTPIISGMKHHEQRKMQEQTPSKSGKVNSGKARMGLLSQSERTDLARRAAESRWKRQMAAGKPIGVICGSEDNRVDIQGVKIPCYVLEDERRVITVNGLQLALGFSSSGGTPRLVDFISRITGNSSAGNDLSERLNAPIPFATSNGGRTAFGYEGDIIVDICDAILSARRDGQLTPRYARYAERAEIIISSLAKTAIVALIDEATGYQYIRSRNALSEILSKYISSKLMPWTKRFPDQFYIKMFKLKGWDFSNLRPGGSKPSVVGRYTRNIVYQRLAPAIIEELERKNPSISPGVRRFKHHQWLTEDIGHAELRSHLEKVIMLMDLSDDWEQFRANLRRAMPQRWEQYQFIDLFPQPENETAPASDDGLD